MDEYLLLRLIILAVLLQTSVFFSAVETCLLSFPRHLLPRKAEEGGLQGAAFKEWMDHPNSILTAILIGTNAVNIFVTTLVAYMSIHVGETNHWSLAVTSTVASVAI